MDTNMVLNQSFNELVFENRHKDYGAYQIRKHYSQNVLFSAILAISFFGLLFGAYFLNAPDAKAVALPTDSPKIDPRVIHIDVIKNNTEQKKQQEPLAPKGNPNTITSNIVVDKDSVAPTNMNDTIGVFKGKIGGIGKLIDTSAVATNPCTNCDTTHVQPKRVKWLPNPPKDPGLDAFFVKNIHYPQMAKEQGIEGVVYLTFVVDTKGNVKDIEILKGANPMLDREVLRVAKIMPNWEPVKDDNGELVEYQYSKPVRFKLQK
ncbi:hypothetical protein BH09BAC5_BH09BAC5_07320 [soil metagenome]